MCNFIVIRLHGSAGLGLPLFLIMLSGSSAGLTFLSFTHIKFGEIYESSKKFIGTWNRNSGEMLENDRRLFKKYLGSYEPSRINLGPFGFYHKSNTFNILGKVILYTSKLLLMTKKLSF